MEAFSKILSTVILLVAYYDSSSWARNVPQTGTVEIAKIKEHHKTIVSAVQEKLKKLSKEDLKIVLANVKEQMKKMSEENKLVKKKIEENQLVKEKIEENQLVKNTKTLTGPSLTLLLANTVQMKTTLSDQGQKCSEKVKDNLSSNMNIVPTETQMKSVKKMLDECALKCDDKIITHMAVMEDMCMRLEKAPESDKCKTFIEKLKESKPYIADAEETDIMKESKAESAELDCASMEGKARKMETMKADRENDIDQRMRDSADIFSDSEISDCKISLARRKCFDMRKNALVMASVIKDEMVKSQKQCTDQMKESIENVSASKDLMNGPGSNADAPLELMKSRMADCLIGGKRPDMEQINRLERVQEEMRCEAVFKVAASEGEPTAMGEKPKQIFENFKNKMSSMGVPTAEMAASRTVVIENDQMRLDKRQELDRAAEEIKNDIMRALDISQEEKQKLNMALELERCRAMERMAPEGKRIGGGSKGPICTLNPNKQGDSSTDKMLTCMRDMQSNNMAPLGEEGIDFDKVDDVEKAIFSCTLSEEEQDLMEVYYSCDVVDSLDNMFKSDLNDRAKFLLDDFVPKMKAQMNSQMNGEKYIDIDLMKELENSAADLPVQDKDALMIQATKEQWRYGNELYMPVLPLMQQKLKAPTTVKDCMSKHGDAFANMDELDRPRMKAILDDMKIKCGLNDMDLMLYDDLAENQICPKILRNTPKSDLDRAKKYLVENGPVIMKMDPDFGVDNLPNREAMEKFKNKVIAKIEEGGMKGRLSSIVQCHIIQESDDKKRRRRK